MSDEMETTDSSPASQALSSSSVFWGEEDHKISFSPTADFSPDDNPFQAPAHHITAVAISPDSSLLALSAGGIISLYDATTLSLKFRLHATQPHVHALEFGEIPSALDSDLDEYVLVADGSADASFRGEHALDVWNLDSFSASLDDAAAANDDVVCVEDTQVKLSIPGTLTTFGTSIFHPDRSCFLYLSRNDVGRVRKSEVSLFDLQTSSVRFTLREHEDNVMCACFSPRGDTLATTGWDQMTRIYDAKSGALLRSLGPSGRQNWACAFAADGSELAVVTGGSKVLVYLTLDDGRAAREHDITGHWARSVAWSPGAASKLAVGAMAGGEAVDGSYIPARLSIFDVKSDGLAQAMASPDNRDLHVADTQERMVEVNDVRWIQAGRKIVWRTSDGHIRIYGTLSNRHWTYGPRQGRDIFPHGQWFKRLVVAENDEWESGGDKGWVGSVDADGAFRVWKIPT